MSKNRHNSHSKNRFSKAGGSKPGQRPGQKQGQKPSQKPGRGPSSATGTGHNSGPNHPGKRPAYNSRPSPFRPAPSGPKPSIEAMGVLLKRSGITLEPKALERLWAYHNLLRSHNQDRDLTRIVGFEPMVIKHYADCLWVGKLTELPSPIIDVGTGAGFPGIPLKISQPDVHFVLAEPRPRRVEFLRMVVQKLGLKNCEVFEHRVVSRSYQIPVKGVITRALETLDKTFLRTSGCTQPGTRLIFMKGPNADEEMREVQRKFGRYFHLIQDDQYTIPHTPHERRLLVYERTDEPFLVTSE